MNTEKDITRLNSVMWVCLCFPRHIHSSWSTVMALLCIPVPRLVSCTFSTIPICPFLIQIIFSFTCLHSFYLHPANFMYMLFLRWPRRVIHCALRQMRNGTPQWNTAMELTVNGRSQWKPAAMLGPGVEQRHLR